jgi:hypothetical protein
MDYFAPGGTVVLVLEYFHFSFGPCSKRMLQTSYFLHPTNILGLFNLREFNSSKLGVLI